MRVDQSTDYLLRHDMPKLVMLGKQRACNDSSEGRDRRTQDAPCLKTGIEPSHAVGLPATVGVMNLRTPCFSKLSVAEAYQSLLALAFLGLG